MYDLGKDRVENKSIDPKYIMKVESLFNDANVQEEKLKYELDIKTIERDGSKVVAKIQKFKKLYEEEEKEGD